MPRSRRFYGFMSFSPCYHESKNCPVIKHVVKVGRAEIRDYKDEVSAVAAGHVRRCKLCLGRKVFDLEGDKDPVRMSDNQYNTLKIIVNIYNRKGGMTLREISDKRKRSVVSTYLIVKKLRHEGLVEHKMKMGAQKASGRSIAPTKRGVAIMTAAEVVLQYP